MTVSRIRMNFSASMWVASLMVASLVPSRLGALNSITYPRAARPAAWPQFGSGANARPKGSGTGLIGPIAGAYCEDEEVRRHLPQMPRRLSPG